MSLYINEIATAVPEFSVTQEEAFVHLQKFFDLSEKERLWYKKLFRESPIEKRHLGLDKAEDITRTDQDELVARFKKQGRKIGRRAARKCLEKTETAGNEIARLTVNSCTGYLCPGLTSYLAEDLNLKKDIAICDLMGMGCGGALPNLQTTANYIHSNKGARGLAVAVEVCSATFFRGEDPGLMVSNAIFGDGAGALLLSTQEGPFEILDFSTVLLPEQREKLMYKTENNRLRNVLSPEIPEIGTRACREVVADLLARNGLEQVEVEHWAVHPGGKTVLDEISSGLNLSREKLKYSYSVFENYGNMSSPSVIFVLKELMEQADRRAGDYLVMTSFGAGFSAHACLLKVNG